MKKTFIAIAAFLMITTPALAEFFFEKNSGSWVVYGHSGGEGVAADGGYFPRSCYMQTKWRDGSDMQVIQDLEDGELYIVFNNNEWNIEGPYDTNHSLTMNMYSRTRNKVESWNANFTLLDKNSITIRGIDYKKFLPAFMNYSKMVFIMPGSIENSEVSLEGTTNGVSLMSKCIEEAGKLPQLDLKKFEVNPTSSDTGA